MNSQEIKNHIKDHLNWDTRINSGKINVNVDENGIVKLEGEIPSYSAKESAEKDAKLIEGVNSVVNQLEVKHFAATRPLQDSEIKSIILKFLRINQNINLNKLGISVNAGYVTLKGTLGAYWKKKEVEHIVSEVNGVIDINNLITVEPPKEYNDKNIAKTIAKAIRRSRFVDADKIDISVSDGKVTLKGKVDNWKAYEEIAEATNLTNGVKKIENKLIVKQY